MNISDCFAIFSLSTDASKSEVKKRYRDLAKRYHPDSHSEDSSREKFEKLQEAYETIEAFFEFSSQHENEVKNNMSVHDERIDRIRRARAKQKERKRQEEYKIQKAILDFRSSKKFVASRIIAIFALLLGIFIVIDFYIPATIEYEPIQGVEVIRDGKDSYSILYAQDRVFEVTLAQGFILQRHKFVLVESTYLQKQIKKVYFVTSGNKHEVEYRNASMYNEAVIPFFIFLSFGFVIFFVKRDTVGYYFMLRYYNLYILPLPIFYILFGDGRVFYLLGVF